MTCPNCTAAQTDPHWPGYAPEPAEVTTSPGAADPDAARTGPTAVGVEALQAETAPGAQAPRDGIDFTREFDDGGLTLEDPAEVARARAATIDYEPTAATPQWDTAAGAAPARQPGLDMLVPEIDTSALELDTRTPSQRMGIDPAAGPLSRVAAQAVDVAPANGVDAQQVAALTPKAQVAINSEASIPQSFPNGVANGPQADQAQQAAAQPAQGRAAPAGQPAGQGLTDGGTSIAHLGAQAAPATTQTGQAQAATETVAERPDNWRTSMLRAGPVAKGMGIDPKGKRLAQVVAEVDAADAQRAGVVQDGADLSAGQIDREWSAFAPETGTLGVPRAEMPQIRAEHRGALVNFLKARGIGSRAAEVPANDLKPTQAEFSPSKVAKARVFQGGDRSILVSSDGYVVDGHHQWLAKRANGEAVRVIRLQAPIREVLAQVGEFPSISTAAGASPGEPNAIARDLRLADERASGAGVAAPNGASPAAGGATPAVVAGQRQGGGTAQPRTAVREGVPAAGGAGQQTAGVAAQGREVSREVGRYKEGLSEFRANQVRAELARKNPGVIYTVEEDSSLKNGFAVVGREPAAGQKLGMERLKAARGRSPEAPKFSRGLRKSTDFVPNADGGLDYGEITPAMGKEMRRQVGKIRLRQGNEAWGLTHIEARHGDAQQ